MTTLHRICVLDRTHLLTLLAFSVENLQNFGYLSNGNRSNFLFAGNSTAWLYGCLHLLPPLCEADDCFKCLSMY